jgi:hypothetical protein
MIILTFVLFLLLNQQRRHTVWRLVLTTISNTMNTDLSPLVQFVRHQRLFVDVSVLPYVKRMKVTITGGIVRVQYVHSIFKFLVASLINSAVSAGALFVCTSNRVLHPLSHIFTFDTGIRLLPNVTSRSNADLVFTMDLHQSHLSIGQVYRGRHY